MFEGVSVSTAIGLSLQTGLGKQCRYILVFQINIQQPNIDALGKANSNISSGLVVVGAAVAEDLDVDPGQLLVLVNGGLVLGQVREPLAHGLQVALQVQDNANLNNQFSLAFHKTIKLTGLPSLKAATAQAAAGTEAFEIWDLGDRIENPAVKKRFTPFPQKLHQAS